MAAPYTGICACGNVSATVSGEPVTTRQCWCRQCRRSCGGGPANNAIFKAEHVEIDGELSRWSYTAASGNQLSLYYCSQCGTGVGLKSSVRPEFTTLRFGFLDEPHGLSPQVAIWTGEAPDWAVIDPALEQFEGQPPPPGTR